MADHERTEKATSRRRKKALDQGQFPYSQEVTGVLTLFACLAVAYAVFSTPTRYRVLFESVLRQWVTLDSPASITAVVRETGVYFLLASAPIFVAAIVAALAGNLLQGLPMFSSEATTLKWSRLNPVAGFSNLKAKLSPIEWGKILFLILVAGAVFWNTLRLYWPELVSSAMLPLGASNDLIRKVTVRIITYLAVAFVVMATADFFIQRWRFEESIKMTKAEVKEDAKALEGNPAIKGKIRSIQRERARRRMMARVKEADVIVTNPTHYAVALEYKVGDMAAPRVVAKGRGWLAQRIKAEGREHDIPMVENVPLARALYRSVEVEQEIPAELYKAVAEVLAFVFRARKQT